MDRYDLPSQLERGGFMFLHAPDPYRSASRNLILLYNRFSFPSRVVALVCHTFYHGAFKRCLAVLLRSRPYHPHPLDHSYDEDEGAPDHRTLLERRRWPPFFNRLTDSLVFLWSFRWSVRVKNCRVLSSPFSVAAQIPSVRGHPSFFETIGPCSVPTSLRTSSLPPVPRGGRPDGFACRPFQFT